MDGCTVLYLLAAMKIATTVIPMITTTATPIPYMANMLRPAENV